MEAATQGEVGPETLTQTARALRGLTGPLF